MIGSFLIPVSVPGAPVSSPSPYKLPVLCESADVPICLFVCDLPREFSVPVISPFPVRFPLVRICILLLFSSWFSSVFIFCSAWVPQFFCFFSIGKVFCFLRVGSSSCGKLFFVHLFQPLVVYFFVGHRAVLFPNKPVYLSLHLVLLSPSLHFVPNFVTEMSVSSKTMILSARLQRI